MYTYFFRLSDSFRFKHIILKVFVHEFLSGADPGCILFIHESGQHIRQQLKKNQYFFTTIQLGKGKWLLETILMFLD